jgi:hypothetical protein
MSDVTSQISTNPITGEKTIESKFNRTPYIVTSIIFIVIIIVWIVILCAMYYQNSGLFGGSSERPPPSDPDLIPINGEMIELTEAEKQTLNLKVEQALNNINNGTNNI